MWKTVISALCVAWLMPVWATTAIDARLAWSDRRVISTPLSGVVAQVLVSTGDRVGKGQALMRLHQAPYLARQAAARSALAAAQQAREEAARERDRTQALYDRTLLSDHELQLAFIALSEAEAAYRRAQADLREAEQQLDDSELNAPYDARIVALPVRAGETVVNRLQATPMVIVARSGRMRATALLDAERIGEVSPGQAMTVLVGNAHYEARVVEIGTEPAQGKGALRYRLAVEFAVSGPALRPGQPARLVLP